MTKEQFRSALLMANQIGGEKVANLDNPRSAGRKQPFGAILGPETKEDICSVAGLTDFSEFSETEQDALLFAYCKGWTAEVDAQKAN